MICDRPACFFDLLLYCLLFTRHQFIYFLSIAFCQRALSLFTFCLFAFVYFHFAFVYFHFAFLFSFCLTLYLFRSDGEVIGRIGDIKCRLLTWFPQIIPHQHLESNISDYQTPNRSFCLYNHGKYPYCL